MDLISRDDLYKKLVYFDYEFNKTNSPLGNPTEEQKLLVSGIISQIRDHILKNMPTVGAIPIEWVIKYDANLCHSPYCFEDDDRSDIERMVDDWRKENGN